MRRELFEGAYRKFWDRIEFLKAPRYLCNSYDICNLVDSVEWKIPFVEMMVNGELRESINWLNSWLRNLERLKIWAAILVDYSDDEAWGLRHHFVEPLVYFCMLQPSSTRDRLGQVATNGVHQANLCVDADYKDFLDQDELKPGQFLSRKKLENQLARLVKRWAVGDQLMAALQSLDSEAHRQKTFDYRNEASHFIAPRVEFGEVQFVTRRREPFPELVKQADGTARLIEHPERKCVAYGFGGIRPLTLAEIIETNSQEYDFAVAALAAYSNLLREAVPLIAARQKARETDANKQSENS
jgi:hypothetical protein